MYSHGPTLHIHPYTPPYFPPTLFPICISIHAELVAGALKSMRDKKHGYLPAPPLTSSPGWGACSVQDSSLPRSAGCPVLSCGQYGPARVMSPGSSHGASPFASPFRPWPWVKNLIYSLMDVSFSCKPCRLRSRCFCHCRSEKNFLFYRHPQWHFSVVVTQIKLKEATVFCIGAIF